MTKITTVTCDLCGREVDIRSGGTLMYQNKGKLRIDNICENCLEEIMGLKNKEGEGI